MIINFKLRQNHWPDSEVVTLGKSFITFDVNFKQTRSNILSKYYGKIVASLPCFKSVLKIFLHMNFLFVNRFSKFLQHIL